MAEAASLERADNKRTTHPNPRVEQGPQSLTCASLQISPFDDRELMMDKCEIELEPAECNLDTLSDELGEFLDMNLCLAGLVVEPFKDSELELGGLEIEPFDDSDLILDTDIDIDDLANLGQFRKNHWALGCRKIDLWEA